MALPISFTFLFQAYPYQYFRVVLALIFKFQIAKEANVHYNMQKVIFKYTLLKTYNIFCQIRIPLQQ